MEDSQVTARPSLLGALMPRKNNHSRSLSLQAFSQLTTEPKVLCPVEQNQSSKNNTAEYNSKNAVAAKPKALPSCLQLFAEATTVLKSKENSPSKAERIQIIKESFATNTDVLLSNDQSTQTDSYQPVRTQQQFIQTEEQEKPDVTQHQQILQKIQSEIQKLQKLKQEQLSLKKFNEATILNIARQMQELKSSQTTKNQQTAQPLNKVKPARPNIKASVFQRADQIVKTSRQQREKALIQQAFKEIVQASTFRKKKSSMSSMMGTIRHNKNNMASSSSRQLEISSRGKIVSNNLSSHLNLPAPTKPQQASTATTMAPEYDVKNHFTNLLNIITRQKKSSTDLNSSSRHNLSVNSILLTERKDIGGGQNTLRQIEPNSLLSARNIQNNRDYPSHAVSRFEDEKSLRVDRPRRSAYVISRQK